MHLKKKWLKNLSFSWLLQGHLTEEEAIKIVNTAESAIEYKKLDQSKVEAWRLIKPEDKTIYNIDQLNEVADNPNSALLSLFNYGLIDKNDFVSRAKLSILISMMKTPCFQTLRTKE